MYAKVLHVSVDLVGKNEYGSVSGGQLKVQAPTTCGRLGNTTTVSIDPDVILLDDELAEERVTRVELDDGIVLDASLDEPCHRREVAVCLMLEDTWANGRLSFLLLQEDQDRAGIFQRVGLGTKVTSSLTIGEGFALRGAPLLEFCIV